MVLTAVQAAFVESGVSISASSRDRDHYSSLARGLGCRVAEDRQQLRLLLSATRSTELLSDVRTQRVLATVYSLPSTHETLQIKSSAAWVEAAQPGDAAYVARHVEAFAAQIMPLGFSRAFVSALLDYEPGDLIAVRFSVEAVYTQTPGPRAGERLAAA